MQLGSIVIPAHNEVAVIDRTLSALAPALRSGEIDVVVVANGCTDDTAAIARRHPGVRVLELEAGSKVLALRAGDAAVSSFPRLYLDADIELQHHSAVAALRALRTGGQVAGRPPFVYDLVGASPPVAAYFRARSRLASLNTALWGAGVYGLSAEGRARFGEFPDVIGDDLYVDGLFARDEIAVFDAAPAVVRVPRTTRSLLEVLGRVYSGQEEQGTGHTTRQTLRELAATTRFGPRAALDAAVYAGLVLRARWRHRRRPTSAWASDRTTRPAPATPASQERADFAVVTPSFRGDFEQFRELRRSVELHVPGDVSHYVIVPSADVELFSTVRGVVVVDEATLLPPGFHKVPGKNWNLNVRRPWWPIRGWVLQQALKLTLTQRLAVDHVVIADSDCVFVRDLESPADLCFVARPGGVTEALPRHVIWHQVGRRMLGLPPDPVLPRTDYVSSVTTWRPPEVRRMCELVEATTGRSWFDLVTGQRHFSEFTLYGLFVEHFGTGPRRTVRHWAGEHWDETPLDLDAGLRLVEELGPDDAALMISAKSSTPKEVRRAIIERARIVQASRS